MFNIFKKKKQDILITTSTGELCLPVRVYYKIHNTRLLRKALRKLKCIQFTEEDDNWFTIFYCKEAKKLSFNIFSSSSCFMLSIFLLKNPLSYKNKQKIEGIYNHEDAFSRIKVF